MMLERIEAPVTGTDNPFVVKDSDLDIFNEDNFDFFTPPPPSAHDAFEGTASDFVNSSAKRYVPSGQRRSSICSTSSSSNSSMSSKSFNFGQQQQDEEEMSLASMEYSVSSRRSRRSMRRRSTCSNYSNCGSSSSSCHNNDANSEEMSLQSNSGRSSRRSVTPPKKKSVAFHSRIKVRGIPHLKDTSQTELANRWYQEDELAEIKQEASRIIKRAKSGASFDNDEEECVRGLHMSKKQQRRSLWVMALSCVLDEQKRQIQDGLRDPLRLAKLYKSFSFCSEQMAQANGKSDAQAVRDMM